MKKIQFLFEGNFEINRRDSHFLEGETVEVDDADADRLIKGLCAVELTDEPKPKPRKRKEVE